MMNGKKGEDHRTAIVLEDSDEEEIDEPVHIKPVEEDVKPVNSMAAFGDRAKMERERLERQRKRRCEASLTTEEDAGLTESPSSVPAAKKIARQSEKSKSTIPQNNSNQAKEGVPMYWNGTIQKSFNIHCSSAMGKRFEEFIRPTTPFRSNGLTHVIMATFCEDIQWLSQMFPKGESSPEITMITLSDGNIKPGVYAPLHPQLPNWIRLVVPRRGLNEYTTMHMKFVLLFYQDRMRMMILSGNLVDYDWSRIENTAFIHDFHKLQDGEKDTSSSYGIQMRRVLSSLSVPSGHFAMRMMETYDMHSQSEARIVASIPTFKPVVGWAAIEELGLGRLGKVVGEILEGKTISVNVEAQGSSMGSYSPRWLQQFHLICTGANPKTHLPLPIGAKATKVWANATKSNENDNWPSIRLLFPSDSWVKNESVEGVNGALTFFGKRKVSVEKGFIRLIHQPISVRGNIMMHHKAILAVRKDLDDSSSSPLSSAADSKEDKDDIIGWAYMGSHNLTQAAWGNISSPKKGPEVQISINNWELGVIVPMRLNDLMEAKEQLPSRTNANIITWKRPVKPYGKNDVPWDQFDQ